MVTSITASFISLVVIIILNIIYKKAAYILTEFEDCSQVFPYLVLEFGCSGNFYGYFVWIYFVNIISFLKLNNSSMIHFPWRFFVSSLWTATLPCSISRFSRIRLLELLVSQTFGISSGNTTALILFVEDYNYIEAGERRFRWPRCPEGGCSYQLAIQLIVTMVGKQIFNNCTEFISVLKFTWLKRKFRWFSKCCKVKYNHNSVKFRFRKLKYF